MPKLLRSWMSLLNRVEHLTTDCTPNNVAKEFVSWLSTEPQILKKGAALGYNFEEYTKLNLGNYPINESKWCEPEFENLKKSLQRHAMGGSDSAFLFLRDTLEKLFFQQIEKECPNCGCWEFSVHRDTSSNRLVDMCNQCGSAYFKDGSSFKTGNLYFATNDELKTLE